MDILAGADHLYVWYADGTAPVDADGSPLTSGDFTTQGSYYAGGASVADLDGGGIRDRRLDLERPEPLRVRHPGAGEGRLPVRRGVPDLFDARDR